MDLQLNFQTADPLYLQIERFIRLQIENGSLKTGERLPSTEELSRQWSIGVMAVQRAMNHLVADGLVERKPMKGTYVKSTITSTPIAILTGINLTDESEYFHRLIVNHIKNELSMPEYAGWEYHIYDNMRWNSSKDTSFSMKRFSSDLRNISFKGGIAISFNEGKLRKKISFQDFPFVNINFSWQNAPTDIMLDYYDFGFKSVAFLAEKNLRKIIYFRTLDNTEGNLEDIRGIKIATEKFNLPDVEVFQLDKGIVPQTQVAYKKTTEMIEYKRLSNTALPDAVIISDDVVAQFVVLAFIRSFIDGNTINYPLFISISNEGILIPCVIPVARYDIPTGLIAKTLLKVLRNRIRKEDHQKIPVKISSPNPITYCNDFLDKKVLFINLCKW